MEQSREALKEFAEVLFPLSDADAVNEKVFSPRKHIVGDREGRFKNDIVTAHVRLRVNPRRTDGSRPRLK
jgi:hypothetical protein